MDTSSTLRHGMLNIENKNRIKEVLDYARGSDIRMMLESNSPIVARDVYYILASFPEFGYVLDLGHLNCGRIGGALGCNVGEFVRNVKIRLEYIYASNNYGACDKHYALAEGTLN